MEGQIKCFPNKVKLKEFIITKPLLYEMLRDFFKKKKMIKTMSIKMAINSQLSTIESKRQTKQASKHNTNRIINTDIIWRVIIWKGGGGQ